MREMNKCIQKEDDGADETHGSTFNPESKP